MTAALLAPGPSLARTFDDDFAGLRIGVNEAALSFRCDWWAAIDLPVYLNLGDQVSASHCLTNRNTLDSLIRRRSPWAAVATVTDDLSCPVKSWTGFTATCALVLLGTLGAKDVKVYGADWTPEPGSETRSADRFKNEKVIWDGVVEWLAGRGVSVIRIGHATGE